MDWIYTGISQILLFWHTIWHQVLPGKTFLATNWEWILAIVFLVITVRVILFPLFVKQIKSQRAMQKLQPQVKALQEKYKDDRQSMQKELMELYRAEKANPLMGCLPLVLQIPIFFGLFHVLKRLNPQQLRDKTLYGWAAEQFDSASAARLFGAPIYQSFSTGTTGVKIVAAVLVLIMIATTYMTSKQMILKTGWSEDPQQRLIQKLMLYGIPASLLISGFLYPFPIGVVIYWTTTNLFSMGQQFWVLRKYPPPVNATAAAGGGRGAAGRGTPAKPSAFSRLMGRLRPGSTAAPAASTPPPVDGKALAPRPGAKPINPKKAGPRPAPAPGPDGAASSASSASSAAAASGSPAGSGSSGASGSSARSGSSPASGTPAASDSATDPASPAPAGSNNGRQGAAKQAAAKQTGGKQPAKQTGAKQTGGKQTGARQGGAKKQGGPPAGQKRAKRPTG
jgi:YidC/Oxa1 family membrane protein insertase